VRRGGRRMKARPSALNREKAALHLRRSGSGVFEHFADSSSTSAVANTTDPRMSRHSPPMSSVVFKN
jgi:hypothetical protein